MRRFLDGLCSKCLESSPLVGLYLILGPGLLLLASSFLLGIDSVKAFHPLIDTACNVSGVVEREVGYSQSINWSLSLVVIFPIFVYLCLELVQAIDLAFGRLRDRRMVVGSDFAPIPTDVVRLEWRRRMRLLFRWGLPGFLFLTLVFSLKEWWTEPREILSHGLATVVERSTEPKLASMDDSFCGGLAPASQGTQDWCELAAKAVCLDLEIGWGVAASIGGPPSDVGTALNHLFTFAAFLWQAVSLSLVLLFIGCLAVFASVVGTFSKGVETSKLDAEVLGDLGAGETVRLVPQLASGDERRGFELFEPGLRTMVVASGVIFVAFYLTRLRNTYLRSNLEVENLLGFVIRDFGNWTTWFAVDWDYSSKAVVVLMVNMLVAVILVSFLTVRRGAARSKAALQDRFEVIGVGPGDVRTRILAGMKVWPDSYITQVMLLIGIFSALACMVVYKLGIFYLLGILVVAVVHTMRLRKKEDGRKRERAVAVPQRDTLSAFVSYAHEDEGHREALEAHLAGLQRQGLLEVWTDRKIEPGQSWATEIDDNLEAADIVLLLVSSDFIASDYAFEIEMGEALKRHQKGLARVIPIIVRPVDFVGLPFAGLQALPPKALPVTKWPNPDEAWTAVAQGIRTVAQGMLGRDGDDEP